MKNKIVIIANGLINDINFHKKLSEDADLIICADGGANNAKKMNLHPDYIIGDFDSTNPSVIEFFKNQNTNIIKDQSEDKTDLELALSLAESLDPKEILILGAFGDRIDHTLANILCLTQIKAGVKAQMIDDKNIVELVEKSTDITGEKDSIISVVPLTDVSGLSYNGLKWLVSDKNTRFGWFGISNKLTKNNANISLTAGKILVIHVRE